MPFASTRPTGAELAELVRAVARDDRAIVIDAANRSRGWTSVHEALGTGVCFAVVPARGVLALDADDARGVRALGEVARALQAASVRYVLLASGGLGRRHLFARVHDDVLFARLVAMARAGGVDARVDAPIRPPGVAHRSGTASELLEPGGWREAVEALSAVGVARRVTARVDPGAYRRDDGSEDPSRAAFAACVQLVRAGVGMLEARGVLEASPAGASLRKRGRLADAWFARTWVAAAAVAHTRSDAGLVHQELDVAWESFCAVPRSGARGSSETAVFAAACELARRAGSTRASMSVRELAVWSGKDPKTVRRALGRLAEEGRLVRISDAVLDAAAVWEVTRVDPPRSLEQGGRVRGGGTVRGDAGSDAVRALGTGAWRVLEAVAAGCGTRRAIVERTGLHPGSVRRAVRKLVDAGLVTGDAELAVSGTSLEAVGAQSVWAGWRAGREARFHAEQEAFERVLNERPELAIRMLHATGVRTGGSIWAWRPRARRAASRAQRAA